MLRWMHRALRYIWWMKDHYILCRPIQFLMTKLMITCFCQKKTGVSNFLSLMLYNCELMGSFCSTTWNNNWFSLIRSFSDKPEKRPRGVFDRSEVVRCRIPLNSPSCQMDGWMEPFEYSFQGKPMSVNVMGFHLPMASEAVFMYLLFPRFHSTTWDSYRIQSDRCCRA